MFLPIYGTFLSLNVIKRTFAHKIPKKKKKIMHLKSSIKLPNERETNNSIIYTHRETMASLLIHITSIFEKPKKEKHEIYTQTIT
jgi:hypothetical protein